MLAFLSEINWSEVSTDIVKTVIGAIFSLILIPLIVNFFKKRSEKRKSAKEKEEAEKLELEAKENNESTKSEQSKKVAEKFLECQFNQINKISDGFSGSTTLDTTWDFGICRQLISKEMMQINMLLSKGNSRFILPLNVQSMGLLLNF